MESHHSQATAAVLRSGASAALAGHAAAVLTLLPLSKGGPAAWIAVGSLLVWGVEVYLAIRVQMDARFFELFEAHHMEQSAEQLDRFLEAAGFRKNIPPRTMQERQRGALRLWRALVFAVAAQIALLLAAILYWLA
jgi:hypothetical protein